MGGFPGSTDRGLGERVFPGVTFLGSLVFGTVVPSAFSQGQRRSDFPVVKVPFGGAGRRFLPGSWGGAKIAGSAMGAGTKVGPRSTAQDSRLPEIGSYALNSLAFLLLGGLAAGLLDSDEGTFRYAVSTIQSISAAVPRACVAGRGLVDS